MSDLDKKLSFLEEFPSITKQEWEAKIHADLKGADYEKKLVWRTIEGLNVRPYYMAEDIKENELLNGQPGQFPFIRGNNETGNDWEIRQDFIVENVAAANKQILSDLNKGVTSIGLLCEGKIKTLTDLETLFKDVYIECVPVHFVVKTNTLPLLKLYKQYAESKNVAMDQVKGSISFDPIGTLVSTGNFISNESTDFSELKELIEVSKTLPQFKVVGVNGLQINNAGSSIVQELAYALSMANEYMAKATELGIVVKDIASKIQFNLGVGSNYFMEIAKFRAARLLWAKIVEAYEANPGDAAKMFIHANTTSWNKTVYDSHVNMLRVTTESMAAILGNVNSLTVSPFDEVFKASEYFSQRIARNTQIILKEEAYFDKIVDPSAGSYYIETLTSSIAAEAWKLFNQTEDEGGFIEAFKKGSVQATIKKTVENRKQRVATRREILLGTNQYPNFNEVLKTQIEQSGVETSNNTIAEPITQYRAAADFEKLRLASDKADNRPKAFMLTIGALVWRKARATFACNFFACAGYEVVDNFGFDTIDAGLQAAKETKADVIVICSSDDEYETLAVEASDKLNGQSIFVVAGAPKCAEQLKQKGIENFVHVKSNVLETLQGFNKQLGIN